MQNIKKALEIMTSMEEYFRTLPQNEMIELFRVISFIEEARKEYIAYADEVRSLRISIAELEDEV